MYRALVKEPVQCRRNVAQRRQRRWLRRLGAGRRDRGNSGHRSGDEYDLRRFEIEKHCDFRDLSADSCAGSSDGHGEIQWADDNRWFGERKFVRSAEKQPAPGSRVGQRQDIHRMGVALRRSHLPGLGV